jgi:flavin reductase (NADH)
MKRSMTGGIHIGGPGPDDSAEAQLRAGLKEVAAQWPSGVAVVAVRDGTALEAITATSFITVSLEPPLVLVSIGEQAAIVPLLDAVGRFTISPLSTAQGRTASMVADRLPTSRSLFDDAPDPVLAGALATLVCRTEAVHPAGDHRLYVGQVVRIEGGHGTAEALAYYRRRYGRVATGRPDRK